MRRFVSEFLRGSPRGQEPYVHLLVAYTDEEITDRRKLRNTVRGFPLTWWTVWCCILLSLSLGLGTASSNPSRFSSHIFDAMKAVFAWVPGDHPMAGWGWLLTGSAVLLAVATHVSPMAVVVALRVISPVYLLLAILVAVGASGSNQAASFSGVPLCLFPAVIHLAAAQTIRMILRYRFPKDHE